MDNVYEAALKRQAKLQDEINILNKFIEMHHKTRQLLGLDSQNKYGTSVSDTPVSETVNDPIDGAAGGARREAQGADDPSARRTRVTGNPKPETVVAAAVEVIRAAKRPMSRRSIHKALAERGVVVKGTDPVKALGTILWRSGKDELVQIEGRGYGLKGVDYEPKPTQESLLIQVIA